MTRRPICVTIGGEAGQGLVTIGELLVKVLVRSGYFFVVDQDYMSRIRGGQNSFSLRISPEPISAVQETVDILVALHQDTYGHHRDRLAPDALVIADEAFSGLPEGALAVPYSSLAKKRFVNVAALGAIGAVLGLSRETVRQALEKAFGKKHPETVADNEDALSHAYEWCEPKVTGRFTLAPAQASPGRLALNGNQAIALGALAGGVRFCSFYPMTPSTSIALTLASQAGQLGLVVEQVEDEIAAINMALGASNAGAPSLVTTSGGGFALMTEGVSLAGITEIPIVVAVVQRPGPATGLPTRTEQGDLEFVLHAGHGEFPRAIMAPGDIGECFDLTRRAFDLAERFQSPVFVLSDQFLADSFRPVSPFDLENGPVARPASVHDQAAPDEYLRYADTENGVSPRLLPGWSRNLVVVDSDEHTPDGHLTEDLGVRVQMNDKRLRKMEGLIRETLAPLAGGDEDPDLLLVGWGSTKGAIQAASDHLRDQGTRAGWLHFRQLWPLVPDQFARVLENAKRVVAVEGNAFGQMARLIRRESGILIKDQILRYDGLPITPEYIRKKLGEMGVS